MTVTRPARGPASKTTAMSDLSVDVLVEDETWAVLVPDAESLIARVLTHAAKAEAVTGEVVVLLTDNPAIQDLNARFRGKDRPTNVLSFPVPEGAGPALGDIALASGVLAREAQEQAKPVAVHLAHLALHGFLHLLGYDHQTEAEAGMMEALETKLLAELGYPDPY